MPHHRIASALALAALVAGSVHAQSAETVTRFLSGHGKDDAVAWEFMVSGGRQAGAWTTIPVPSNWEMEGFGSYNYGHDEPKADEIGHYRYRFDVPSSWASRHVDVVFDGVMTDTRVRINGVVAGPVHQGGFYRFRYDVTDLLQYGRTNLLEVDVAKMSGNASVNQAERQADFWVFGGIFRPVFLEVLPAQHIARTYVDARHDGSFRVDVRLGEEGAPEATSVAATIRDADGEEVASLSTPMRGSESMVVLRSRLENVAPWSPEMPDLYTVDIELIGADGVIHRTRERFGFRTIEVRPRDGIYLNGTKIRLKGVNRHSFWPDAGRTTSRAVSEMDVQLMKDMNMNAVRTSHYPPDTHFLDAADSLGLLVIDELTGWQAAYDTPAGVPLVVELIERDHNHPSVILWANGNEGGWNRELDPLFAQVDLQDRTVIHPWEFFGQINTVHYQAYDCCAGTYFNGREIFMPTEVLHGLYDGGLGAGLEDFWSAVRAHPLAAGGFLWALADEGILRTDLGDTLDTDGNHAPDGIVGPYREKEGSYYAIKEIWSPVAVEEPLLVPSFDGRLVVENRYHFTNLRDVTFEWRLVEFPGPDEGAVGHRIAAQGSPSSPSIAPGARGGLDLELPPDWYFHDALFVTATDPHGREVMEWTWMIRTPQDLVSRWVMPSADSVMIRTVPGGVLLRSGDVEAEIDEATGLLRALRRGGIDYPLFNGPRLVSGNAEFAGLSTGARGDGRYVEARYEGDVDHVTWTMLPGGWLELAYRTSQQGEFAQMGMTFDASEDGVHGVRWLGRGPYRVWKNRMRGASFNVWSKPYNDAATGRRWIYPEFKGHHANLYWAVLDTDAGSLAFLTGTEDLFLRLFTPAEGPDPRTTAVDFPAGDISFLNAIPPIGTKFHAADELGPQSQPTRAVRWTERRRVGAFDVVVYIRPGR